MTPSDDTLLHRIRVGDDEAFAMLYNRHKRLLYGLAMSLLRDPDAAGDVLQSVFLRILEGKLPASGLESFRGWAVTVVRNACLNEIRHSRFSLPSSKVVEEKGETDLLSEVECSDQRRLVETAINALSSEHREIILLREFQGFSYEEIGMALGLSDSAVKSRLFRARQDLARLLQPIRKEM